MLDNRNGPVTALNTHFRFRLGDQHLAYCRIRKNACSAMQRLIIETSPHRRKPGESRYAFIRRHHRTPGLASLKATDHRILIVRDPVDRLASLYANKFVERQGNLGLFESYRTVTGRDPRRAGLREFVIEYVSRMGDTPLDPHVWPQSWHLCPVVYDHVIFLRDLAKGMSELISPALAKQYFGDPVNPSSRSNPEPDEELSAIIRCVYAEDYRMLSSIGTADGDNRP